MEKEKTFRIVVKTLYGLEEVLLNELQGFNVIKPRTENRAVSCFVDKYLLYKLNLGLRTAISILMPIKSFRLTNEKQLYDNIYKIEWDKYFTNSDTIMVDSVVNSKYFNHSLYISLKTKDAIVDYFRDKTGKRPDVDKADPDIRINIHIADDKCIVSLNSSGATLNKRGYREMSDVAPINEVLAAGMISLSGWDKKSNFIDPMCGSGTILVEAAYYAMNIPPNLHRTNFCFFNWLDFDKNLYSGALFELKEQIIDFPHKIIGYDNSKNAFRIAQINTKKANVDRNIRLICSSFEAINKLDNYTIITNPPYGERIMDDGLEDLYKKLYETLLHKSTNSRFCIISSNNDALQEIKFESVKTIKLLNGKIECKYLQYNL